MRFANSPLSHSFTPHNRRIQLTRRHAAIPAPGEGEGKRRTSATHDNYSCMKSVKQEEGEVIEEEEDDDDEKKDLLLLSFLSCLSHIWTISGSKTVTRFDNLSTFSSATIFLILGVIILLITKFSSLLAR